MIKFFRKIRQKMLTENKFSKYLLYAVGEIILVMVGILLALQVNNWNEEKKTAEFENTLRLELYNSLVHDLPGINGSISGHERVMKSDSMVLEYLNDNLRKPDSINFLFSNAHFWWATGFKMNAYETAKNHGLHFIKNDSTRLLLADVYENLSAMVKIEEKRQNDYFFQFATSILNDRFEQVSILPYGVGEMIPWDLTSLKTDKQYFSLVGTTMYMRGVDLYFLKILRDNVVELIHLLEMEMEAQNTI